MFYFVDWLERGFTYLYEKRFEMCISFTAEFDHPKVTLCVSQHVKIQLRTCYPKSLNWWNSHLVMYNLRIITTVLLACSTGVFQYCVVRQYPWICIQLVTIGICDRTFSVFCTIIDWYLKLNRPTKPDVLDPILSWVWVCSQDKDAHSLCEQHLSWT